MILLSGSYLHSSAFTCCDPYVDIFLVIGGNVVSQQQLIASMARRSAIAPPKTAQRQIQGRPPVQIDKPEFVTDDTATTGLERGFIEELRRS